MKILQSIAPASALCALAACSQQPEPQPLDVYPVMKDQVDVHADGVWEVGNTAMDEDGGIDGAKMTDELWQELANSADALAADFDAMIAAPSYVVSAKGEPILDSEIEGGITAEMVQAHIDKDPETFRAMAGVLKIHAQDIAAAARAKDAARAGQLVGDLDPVCEGCHLKYWYPELADLTPYAGMHDEDGNLIPVE